MTNIEITKQLLATLAQGDYEGAAAFVADDFVCIEADSMPYAGPYYGKTGFLELMGKLFSTFTGFDLVDVTGDGDSVILQVTMINNSERGIFRMPLTELWHFREGQLIEAIACYFDPLKVQQFVAGGLPEVTEHAFHRKMEYGQGDRTRNIAIVKALLEKAAAGDWESVNEQLAPGFLVVESEATPYGGIYHGEQAFPEIMKALNATWQGLSFSIDEIVADDRRVFMVQTLRGRLGETDLSAFLNEMWEIEGGKIVRVVPFYLDAKKLGDCHARRASLAEANG